MKFTKSLLASSVYLGSCQATEELFLQKNYLDSTISMASTKVPSGSCQILAGLDLYDLKPLESIGIVKGVDPEGTPAVIDKDGAFLFKTCGFPWSMTKPYLAKTKSSSSELGSNCAAKKGNAFYVENGDCSYSFNGSEIENTPGATADADPLGFTLTYTSEEKCTKGDGKFTYTINMVCNKANDGTFISNEGTDCAASAQLMGKQGCRVIGLGPAVNTVKPFIGAILIVIGLIMTFAGAKFII